MPGSGWRDTDNGYRRLRAEMLKLRDRGIVTIGVQDSEAAETHEGEGSGAHVTNAQVATWMEFGTSTIPARSFARSTVDENGQKYYEFIQRLLGGVLDGKYSTSQALALLGERVLADMKLKIRKGIAPPLAASTVRRKHSSKPLINTGQLINALTYKVRSKDEV